MKTNRNVPDEEIFTRVRNGLSAFVPLSDEAWKSFTDQARIRRLKKKEHFLKSGEICLQLGIIYEGYVRHYYLVEGKEVTNDFNFEGMVTGAYHSFIHQTPSRFGVVAMEDTTLIVFRRDHWLLLLGRYPDWQKVSHMLLERIFHRKQLREESFLLDTPEQRYRAIIEKAPYMINRVQIQYLASYLGITSETLSRIRANIRVTARGE